MEPKKARSPFRAEAMDTDYTHIKADLRRIALIASGFIVVMIALSFVIK
jgi:hypothetical protein